MSLFCNENELFNESDVEQKFIMPFLKESLPIGLGYKNENIDTKKTIRSQLIGKGATSKHYIPDYLISIQGLPLLVIEAKSPQNELDDALAEARLYANVINSKYKHKTNVCQKIIATNGKRLIAGYYDSDVVIIDMTLQDFMVENKKFVELIEFASYKSLQAECEKYYSDIKGNSKFVMPITNLGGKKVQNEEMVSNTFGATLAFDYMQIFKPDTAEEQLEIVKNAYVYAQRREQHAEPIYKIIKKESELIENPTTYLPTNNPELLMDKVQHTVKNKIKKSLILIIGNRGSGKSTFIHHFYEINLKEEVKKQTTWIFLDMNNADYDNLSNWMTEQILNKLKNNYLNINFDDKDMIFQVFKKDIESFKNGLGALLIEDEKQYNLELFKILMEKINDKKYALNKYIEYLYSISEKTIVIVLDNCDKRDTQEQLKTFEVAQWLRDQYPILMIMSLRDTTFDTNKSIPPLDTVIKDLTFRIDPPDFFKVLQERLNYAYRVAKDNGWLNEDAFNVTSNIKVKLKKGEHLEYFKNILLSIRNNSFAKDIFYGLAGKDIRRGIEIFLDFCKSGHIPSSHFLLMQHTGGEHELPAHIIMTALLKVNRKYYNDEVSPIKNLFSSEYYDVPPDPFARFDILKFLNSLKKNSNNLNDFLSISELLKSIAIAGHDSDVILRELKYLIKNRLIIYESKTEEIEQTGLIQISVSGKQHINLLSNVVYLAACSECVYYKQTEIAKAISDRLKKINDNNSKMITYENALELINYLDTYKKNYFSSSDILIPDDNVKSLMDLDVCYRSIEKFQDGAFRLEQTLSENPKGKIVEFRILNKIDAGVSGVFENSIRGFIYKNTIDEWIYECCQEGDLLIAEIANYNQKHNGFNLNFIDVTF